MNFLTAAHTDVGLCRDKNEDSVLIEIAEMDDEKVCFAVICDGMGGLIKGEVASAALVRAFSIWFEQDFPKFYYMGMDEMQIQADMERVISKTANQIEKYARSQNVRMGTTVTAMLLTNQKYYVIHIGDTRAYELSDQLYQLTKDQTFIQREMDLGRMTLKEAQKDSRRNMLLQCVGASDFIEPEFLTGMVKKDAAYLLCSDGFRHVLSTDEIYQYLNPRELIEENSMKNQLVYLTELNKYRREDDNISALVIKTC